MIKQIIGYTVIIFLLYNLALLVFKPDKLKPQADYDLNVIKAETYLKNQKNIEFVVVGSSLGNRIDSTMFPDNFYFLTLSGMGIFDGLEVIKHSEHLPKIIFIETNVVDRESNSDFKADACSPMVLNFNKTVPSVLKKNKPSTLFHKSLSYVVYGIRNQFEQLNEKQVKSKTSDLEIHIKNTILQKSLQDISITKNNSLASNAYFNYLKEQMKAGIPKRVLQSQMEKLKNYVEYFKEKNVRIVFYEMPINKELEILKKPIEIQNIFLEDFSPQEYKYIKVPTNFNVISNDGMHLSGESIERYSSFFKLATSNLK